MKALVTGGGGFFGSALVRELKQRGHEVRVLLKKGESDINLRGLDVETVVGDILDKTSLAEAVKAIDVVFHAAAIYKTYPFYERHPSEIYQVNVEGTRNVLEAALSAGVKKVIHTSSIAAVEMPGVVLKARSHYEQSKALAEEIALSYGQRGMHVVSINPGFIFGVGGAGPDSTGERIVRFLRRSYLIYFDAKLAVSDLDTVVEAHIRAMEKGKSGERYVVVSERSYTLREIFGILEGISGVPAPRIRVPIFFVLAISMVHELLIGMLGLGGKVRPIIASEIVRYYMRKTEYDGSKAKAEFGLKDRPIRETFQKAVEYVRKAV